MPFAKAAGEILQYQAEIIFNSRDGMVDINAIGEKAIEKHYYIIRTLIGSGNKGDELSRFVTGDKNITLGERA
jgi:hypothetical protein